MRAATVVVIAAGCSFKRAAAPSQAITIILIDTAAGRWLRARKVAVADCRRPHWRRRWWTWVGRILTFLDGVWWFNGNATLASWRTDKIPLHPDVPFFSPSLAPWVTYNPIVLTFLCAIAYRSHSMIQISPTLPTKNTLPKKEERKNKASIYQWF